MQCKQHAEVTGAGLDVFRRMIVDGEESHSCRRCWVSQKYCATGKDIRNQCQWPNVVVLLARAIAELYKGVEIIRRYGFTGELGGD